MKYLFIVLGIIVLGFVGYHAVRIGFLLTKVQKLNAQASKYERDLPRADGRILIAGDSSAVGVGAGKPEESVAGLFGADFGRMDIVNIGESGLRLGGLERKLYDLDEQRYDMIVIMIGTNDITEYIPIGTAEQNLKDVLEMVTKMSNRVIIMHSGNMAFAPFFPDFMKGSLQKRTLAFREFYQRLADEYKVAYVDLYGDSPYDLKNPNNPSLYAEDGLHLNSEGYKLWYHRIRESATQARIDLR